MEYFQCLAATWPAVIESRDGWTLRRGSGAGNRVSAATAETPDADPGDAAMAMRDMGQHPLFMIRPGEDALDARLAAMGFGIVDETALLAAEVGSLRVEGTERTIIRCDAPLARMVEIWGETGIGAARLDVMARVAGPKVYLLARDGDRPAGCAFAGCDPARGVAMIHALAILPFARHKGLAARATRAAAAWAGEVGAAEVALAARSDNRPALDLYHGLGFREVARYHYRRAPD